jgi:tRNA threonylcarbamoyladenosine biosynthesis protein TsaB
MPAEPFLLAFDTATEVLAVAVTGARGTLAWTGPGGAAASSTLLPRALALLGEAGIDKHQLQAVAFGVGPGAFTGLRTACAAAQGLAFGLGCPVLPLDSLALVAEDSPWRDVGEPVWVAMDARMDEVYAGAYQRQLGGGWTTVVPPALWTLPALAERWSANPPRRVCGSAIAAFGERLPLAGAELHPAETDRAAALARLARMAWATGAAIDPALALPVYLRDKVALTTVERAARKAEAA